MTKNSNKWQSPALAKTKNWLNTTISTTKTTPKRKENKTKTVTVTKLMTVHTTTADIIYVHISRPGMSINCYNKPKITLNTQLKGITFQPTHYQPLLSWYLDAYALLFQYSLNHLFNTTLTPHTVPKPMPTNTTNQMDGTPMDQNQLACSHWPNKTGHSQLKPYSPGYHASMSTQHTGTCAWVIW